MNLQDGRHTVSDLTHHVGRQTVTAQGPLPDILHGLFENEQRILQDFLLRIEDGLIQRASGQKFGQKRRILPIFLIAGIPWAPGRDNFIPTFQIDFFLPDQVLKR